jgi:thiol-disulfide isomerase/thioredoxin
MRPDVRGIRLPKFPEMAWINSPPLTPSDIDGKPLLVTFWDYTTLNCLHTMPRIRQWHEDYSKHDLVVVGIHTPGYPFGRDRANVERARAELGIPYPIALDNEFHCWRAFQNRYWPARYLFDASGSLRYYHFGEGDYGACEESIRECLREARPASAIPAATTLTEETTPAGTGDIATVTPELHIGLERGRIANAGSPHAGEMVRFSLPDRREAEQIYLEGAWRTELSHVESAGNEPAFLHLRCRAAEVNVILASSGSRTIEVDITLGGQPVETSIRSRDVQPGASGLTLVKVQHPRLYRLITAGQVDTRDLRLHLEAPGLRIYALNFGAGSDEATRTVSPAGS